MEVITKKVSPDKRGRVSLKGLVDGADGYEASRQPDGTIILKPYLEVDAREAWLYKNPVALKKLKTGLRQLKENKLSDLGDFTQYADIELEN